MSNALLQALAPLWQSQDQGEALPPWFRARQRRVLAAAQAASWPARTVENWKYTSLHALAQRAPSAPEPAPTATAGFEGSGLRFVDGRLMAIGTAGAVAGVELMPLSAALAADDERLRFAIGREDEGGDVFDQINGAFATQGAWLRVAAGAGDEQWLHLDMASGDADGDRAWHLAHRIEIGERARLRLLVDLTGADSARFATVLSRIRVQRDARLDLVWRADAAAALTLIARTGIDLDAGAQLRMQVLDAGAAPSRHDLRIALRGAGARSELGGVFLLDGRRHADLQLDLRHESADASSDTIWRAVAGDRSRAVFDGHITVAAGADGSDARLACKSLLTSAQAEIDAKPVLEIYADDVKCAHGATVGQLDALALFYLRARGLPEAQARSLLQSAFCLEAYGDGEPASPAAERLRAWLDAAKA